ncbi:phosphotransferase enzyme family protein [Marimonas arenosa]|uniref:Phosphotransferase n=1 Tax=Marimonas arenosa TaxID=1795305 RepID=A0AAE4B544_9RHOB|nr:phosphotransferase [Marimonas arenosa]MDQ2090772.1 phosphotransferase [Marimonas arenosa]
MLEIAQEAARLWGFDGARVRLAARRENVVFRVATGAGDFALRLHRPGYRSDDELASELDWMHVLAAGGLDVPDPVARPEGGYLATVGEHQVDVLSWVPGAPLGRAGELAGVGDRAVFCRRLGAVMARMHDISDAWERPAAFTRPAWDRDGLLGEAPLWGRFWEHPHLKPAERVLLERVRAAAGPVLARLEAGADYGLIHADLLSENMLRDGDRVFLIDFDDGGWGFRDFDLATFLLRFEDAPDYPELRRALCEGYAVRRQVRQDELDLFLLLRALTYPGWIADRLGEPGAAERSQRAVATATRSAWRWLETYGGTP